MSNRLPERMVCTVKTSIRNTLLNKDLNWVKAVPQIVYMYRHLRLACKISPFQLISGLILSLFFETSPLLTSPDDLSSSELELVAIPSARADRYCPVISIPSTKSASAWRKESRLLRAGH